MSAATGAQRRKQAVLAVVGLLSVACSSTVMDSQGSGDGSSADGGGGEASSGPGVSGPQVRIHIRANDEPFTHGDDLAGQTPQDHHYGILSLTLYRDPGDPDPMLVFDHGKKYVEASYAPGDDTVVAEVPMAGLQQGRFTYARVTISHVRFRAAATVHAGGLTLPGDFQILRVYANGIEYEGELRDKGRWTTVFTALGMDFTQQGTGAGPGLNPPVGAPIEVVDEGGETALYFAVDLPVDPSLPTDVDIVMDFNVRDCFRWEDQDTSGYQSGIFDASPTTMEPVRHLGANDYAVYVE